ncbi:glycine cleavage system aminomethyltransferase GcvT [Robiginitomaculum antarcticum]|uniref:glycine cleavage system aminomethyltransferase GcvT n=1 Tax=Robiginitomaculum antarcticum TaxID=437507 RepID=UPI0003642DCE|nr:glycine cleavage system aminomethyltransferase GcvT [Robiginitomaculum antarcticum]
MIDLKQTKLHSLHVAAGAKMVPFAGYNMPVQYPLGVLGEHNHTRAKAGLFDVSHMGQCFIAADDGTFETAAKALEKLVPASLTDLEPGQQRYSQFLNEEGGTLDDLMISRLGFEGHTHKLYLVVNAGCKDADYAHIEKHLPDGVSLDIKDDVLSLIALQGPKAAEVLGAMNSAVKDLVFMTHTDLPLTKTIWVHVSRSGYTGEDGFEISVKHDDVEELTKLLLAHDDVQLIGLGARDSLRMEAGLCLYGHELDPSVSPIEAGLIWSIQKHRRSADAGYLGAARVANDLADKSTKRLVGILPEGRAPAREHTEIQDMDGNSIGEITSGGFGPTVGGPVAIGFVGRKFTKAGTAVQLIVRGKPRPAKIVKMPFAAHNYYRGA